MVTLGAPVAILLTIWAGPLLAHRFNPRYLIVAGTGLTCLAFQWFGHLHGSSARVLRRLVRLHARLPAVGSDPASDHHLELVPAKRRGQAMGIAYIGGALRRRDRQQARAVARVVHVVPQRHPGARAAAAAGVAARAVRPEGSPGGPRPARRTATTCADVPALDAAASLTFAGLCQPSSFWLLLVGSAASIGSIASVNFLMKFVFEEQGFTNQAARDQIWSTASFAALIAAIGGRIVVGWLADRMPRKTVMVATYAQVAVAIPLLFLVTPETPHYAYLFGVVFGFAMGADYMLIPLMAADVFGLPIARPRDVGHRAERHDHAVLVAEPDRAAAHGVGRLRKRAVGRVRDRRGRRDRDRAAACSARASADRGAAPPRREPLQSVKQR